MPIINRITSDLIVSGVLGRRRYLYFNGTGYYDNDAVSGELYVNSKGELGGAGSELLLDIGSGDFEFALSPDAKFYIYINGSWMVNNREIDVSDFTINDVVIAANTISLTLRWQLAISN